MMVDVWGATCTKTSSDQFSNIRTGHTVCMIWGHFSMSRTYPEHSQLRSLWVNQLIPLTNQDDVIYFSVEISSWVRDSSEKLGPSDIGYSITTTVTPGFRHNQKWQTKIFPKIGYPQGKKALPWLSSQANRVILHITRVIANLVSSFNKPTSSLLLSWCQGSDQSMMMFQI